jgi:hypothetical protein
MQCEFCHQEIFEDGGRWYHMHSDQMMCGNVAKPAKSEVREPETERYQLSQDRKGLIKFCRVYLNQTIYKVINYHIHENEMNEFEKWMYSVLLENEGIGESEKHHKHTQIQIGSKTITVDEDMVPLLKALNECGLETLGHCVGTNKGDNPYITIRLDCLEDVAIRMIECTPRLLISWKNEKKENGLEMSDLIRDVMRLKESLDCIALSSDHETAIDIAYNTLNGDKYNG